MKTSTRILSACACVPLLFSMAAVSASAVEEDEKVRIIVKNVVAAESDGAAWDGILVDEWVSIDSNSTAAGLLKSVLDENGYSETGIEQNYITEINGLSAGDVGNMSGWMIMLDNWMTDDYISAYTVQSGKLTDGDEFCVAYSLDWGADLGYDWTGKDTSLVSVSFDCMGNGVPADALVTFSPEFQSDVKEYTINVPNGVDSLKVTPETVNTAYRYKVYKNSYTPTEAGTDYKPSQYIDIENGDVIYVGVGNAAWHSYLADDVEESVYTFTVNAESTSYDDTGDDDGDQQDADYNDDITVQQIAGDISEKLLSGDGLTVGFEWEVMTLARFEKLTDDKKSAYLESVKTYLSENEPSTPTEYARLIIALSALGENAADFAGKDLTAGLSDHDYITSQGVNASIFALIALDTKRYDIPAAEAGKTQTTRDMLLNDILSAQLPDGGWTYFGDEYDPDLTGMALTALAPYTGMGDEVDVAVNEALELLSSAQKDDAAYSSFGAENAESCAQVITALCSLGIDPTKDERFAKNGRNVLEALKMFYNAEEKGFAHTVGSEVNSYSTDQAYYAICAYLRLTAGKSALYDMTDLDDVTPVVPDEKQDPASDIDTDDGSETPAQQDDSEGVADNNTFSTGDNANAAAIVFMIVLFVAVSFGIILTTKRNERNN